MHSWPTASPASARSRAKCSTSAAVPPTRRSASPVPTPTLASSASMPRPTCSLWPARGSAAPGWTIGSGSSAARGRPSPRAALRRDRQQQLAASPRVAARAVGDRRGLRAEQRSDPRHGPPPAPRHRDLRGSRAALRGRRAGGAAPRRGDPRVRRFRRRRERATRRPPRRSVPRSRPAGLPSPASEREGQEVSVDGLRGAQLLPRHRPGLGGISGAAARAVACTPYVPSSTR